MSQITQQAADMMEMLPETEQHFALELIKRLVLAWDPDYTRLTPAERRKLENAEHGEYLNLDGIDWDNIPEEELAE